jgi:hypothetical protein
MRSVGAGIAGAAVTALLIFVWFQLDDWVIQGSGFTDLPGQDTLQQLSNLAPYALGVVALVAGRVSGLLCRSTRWLAAMLGVSPLLLLTAVSPRHFRYFYILFPFLAFLGAYAPTWMSRRKRTEGALREGWSLGEQD